MSKIIGLVLSLAIPITAFAGGRTVTSPSEQIPPTGGQSPEAMVSKYGTIKSHQPVGKGGLTAWNIEKNGKEVVLYTTEDSDALIMGVVWDAATGKNLSDNLFINKHPTVQQSPSVLTTPPENRNSNSFAFEGEFKGEMPESIKTVDSLSGYKEGNGDMANTLYIIIDPRCPYCRKAYSMTRKYIEKGATIKWIPTAALGDPMNGIPMAAAILQSEDRQTLHRLLGNHEQIKVSPSKETVEKLKLSLDFMYAAFKQNGDKEAGVPVAFYIDRRTNRPKMMTGVSEPVILEDILGRL